MKNFLILFAAAALAACVDPVPRHRVDVPPVYTTPRQVTTPPPMKAAPPPARMLKPAPAPAPLKTMPAPAPARFSAPPPR